MRKTLRRSGRDWRKQWREQCRRQLARGLKSRLLFGFVRTYRPVLDDAPYRIFESMADYREWCEENLPKFLGYYRLRGAARNRPR